RTTIRDSRRCSSRRYRHRSHGCVSTTSSTEEGSMRKVLWAAALALLAFGAQAQETIKIGVITDRVGVSKPYSEPATEGLLFGAEEINRKGGVLGRKIELLVEDDQSRPDISAALARKLIDQGAVFILSMSLTQATQQQQTVTMEAKMPQMTPM